MAARVLHLFGSAAPPVFDIGDAIKTAQAVGWDVCLGLTPTAARWLEEQLPDLEDLTGHPVRWEYKLPGEPDVWPPCSVTLLAPATFNTINQWALGITNHFTVGFCAEAIGKGIPLVTMPCVNAAYVQHPQFEQSVTTLRDAGVTVLYGPGGSSLTSPARAGRMATRGTSRSTPQRVRLTDDVVPLIDVRQNPRGTTS